MYETADLYAQLSNTTLHWAVNSQNKWGTKCLWLYSPVHFSSIERFGVKGNSSWVATLSTADGDFSAQLHPRHSEDGAGVGAGQREHILLIMLQKVQHPWQIQQMYFLSVTHQIGNPYCVQIL